MQLVFFGVSGHSARCAGRTLLRGGRKITPGPDSELKPASDAGGAIGPAAQPAVDALKVGRVGDLLGEARGEGDDLVDLEGGDGGLGGWGAVVLVGAESGSGRGGEEGIV